MYLLEMVRPPRITRVIATALCLVFLAACGGSDATPVASTAPAVADEAQDHDDHGDEDHDDEDHDDEDHDDHGDEDHEDHDDEDHEDHDSDHDEDHEDHGDEDHDDHDSSGGLDAHVHGSAELFVGASGSDVVVDLISPAINVFGFEREPSDADEQAVFDERTAALAQPDVLVFNSEAECTLVDEVRPELTVEASHAELTASWIYVCANPEQIEQLDASVLFRDFPGFEDIDAQWATDSGASAAELSPSSTILRLE